MAEICVIPPLDTPPQGVVLGPHPSYCSYGFVMHQQALLFGIPNTAAARLGYPTGRPCTPGPDGAIPGAGRVCNNSGQIHRGPLPYTICELCRAEIVNRFERMTARHWYDAIHQIDPASGAIIAFTNSGGIVGIPPTVPRRKTTSLCKICTEDEIAHYTNRMSIPGYANAHPTWQGTWNLFQNECTCFDARVIQNPTSCFSCTRADTRHTFSAAQQGLRWLQGVTRTNRRLGGGTNIRVTASATLKAQRAAGMAPLPCRCGRDALGVVRRPKALFCLDCEGVWIDEGQVAIRGLRPRGVLPRRPRNLTQRFPLRWRGSDDPTVTSDVVCNRR